MSCEGTLAGGKPAMCACVVAIVLGLAIVASTPGIALAHSALVSAQPEAGAELGTAPGVVVLRFSEPLNAKLSRATVTSPDGREFTGATSPAEEIRIPLATNVQGVYEVDWTTVSGVDGHTLSGAFEFGVGVSPGPGAGGATATAPRPRDVLIALARTVEDTALLLALGMLVLGRLARREPRLAWVRLRMRPVLAAALAGGVAVVLAEALVAAPAASPDAVVTYLTTGLPGVARSARPVLEAAALFAALVGTGWTLPPLVGAVVALAAAGHAAAVRPGWWGISVDAVHLLAAGAWAGGILALATLRPPGGWRGPELRTMLERFSPVALTGFVITVGAGVLRGVQEVGHLSELFASSYGRVLLVKVLAVVAMTQLSALAWRRVAGSVRYEAAVAVLVVAAAALLAAYPLPPARLAEAEVSATGPASGSALPKAGDLTLGGDAGQVLVGLTLRPGRPGPNDALVYLLSLEGEQASAALRADVIVSGRAIPTSECGPTCRHAHLDLRGGERILVGVDGPTGGTASFRLPSLPAPDGSPLLRRMQLRMHRLTTYRQDETLSSGLAVVRAMYAFEAPNRYASAVRESAGGSRVVEIGRTRYLKVLPSATWQVERGGPPPTVPSFIWDFFRPFVDARVLGSAAVDGITTRIVAFFGESGGTPVWFRLWIDGTGLVRRAEMRAQGHFMDHRYYDFNGPIRIRPPRV